MRAITTTATVFALSGVSIAGGLAAASGDTKGGGVKVDWGQGQCGPCSANFSDVVLMGNAASGALAMGGGAAVVLAVCPNATTATVALDGVTASGNTVTGPPLGPASSLTMLGGGGVAVSTVSGLAPACALLTPSSAPSSLLVTIQGSSFVGNKCANNNTHGGGFLLANNGAQVAVRAEVKNSVFRQNEATQYPTFGGGFGSYMLAPAAPVALPISYTFEGVVAVGNKGGSGAGIGMKHFLHGTGHVSLTLQNSHFQGNWVTKNGGGIAVVNHVFAGSGMTAAVTNVTFRDNVATEYSGGVYSSQSLQGLEPGVGSSFSNFTFTDCVLDRNVANLYIGGGLNIFYFSALTPALGYNLTFVSLRFFNMMVTDNFGASGGGGLNVDVTLMTTRGVYLSLVNSTITRNGGNITGAGISYGLTTPNNTVVIDRTVVSGNRVFKGSGGGADINLADDVPTFGACNSGQFRTWRATSVVRISDSVFASNAAWGDVGSGGAIALGGGGSIQMTNTMCINNSAALFGGCLYVPAPTASIQLAGATITSNIASIGHQVWSLAGGAFSVLNSSVGMTGGTGAQVVLLSAGNVTMVGSRFQCPPSSLFVDSYGGTYGKKSFLLMFGPDCRYLVGTLQFECPLCPGSSFSLQGGFSDGQPNSQSNMACLPCPVGGYCTEGRVVAKPGHWGAIVSPEEGGPKGAAVVPTTVAFLQCPQGYCCSNMVGSRAPCSSMGACAGNRTGVMCGACAHGTSLVVGSTRCVSKSECAGRYGLATLFWFMVGLGLVAESLLVLYSSEALPCQRARKVPTGKLKLVSYYIQMATMARVSTSSDDDSESSGIDAFMQSITGVLRLEFAIVGEFLSSVSGSVLCGLDNFTAISKVSLNYIAPVLVGVAMVVTLYASRWLLKCYRKACARRRLWWDRRFPKALAPKRSRRLKLRAAKSDPIVTWTQSPLRASRTAQAASPTTARVRQMRGPVPLGELRATATWSSLNRIPRMTAPTPESVQLIPLAKVPDAKESTIRVQPHFLGVMSRGDSVMKGSRGLRALKLLLAPKNIKGDLGLAAPTIVASPASHMARTFTVKQRAVQALGTLFLLAFSNVLSSTIRLLQCVEVFPMEGRPRGLYLFLDGNVRCNRLGWQLPLMLAAALLFMCPLLLAWLVHTSSRRRVGSVVHRGLHTLLTAKYRVKYWEPALMTHRLVLGSIFVFASGVVQLHLQFLVNLLFLLLHTMLRPMVTEIVQRMQTMLLTCLLITNVVSIAQAMLDEVAIATATGVEVSMGAPTRNLLLATQLVFYAIVPIIGVSYTLLPRAIRAVLNNAVAKCGWRVLMCLRNAKVPPAARRQWQRVAKAGRGLRFRGRAASDPGAPRGVSGGRAATLHQD